MYIVVKDELLVHSNDSTNLPIYPLAHLRIQILCKMSTMQNFMQNVY
jgi:hypothetical protein